MELSAELGRRGLLKGALGAAAAAGAGAAFAPATANAARGDRGRRRIPNSKIGIQLWTVRDAFQEDPEGTLGALGEIGYRNIEHFGGFPGGRSAAQYRELLDSVGLRAVSSHVGVPGDNWEQVLDDARTLGLKHVVLPWVGEEYRTAEGVARLAETCNWAGELARRAGLRFGYHNHDWDFLTMVGGRPWHDVFAELTDPHVVKLQVDIMWAAKGGADPVELFDRYQPRVRSVHVKDMNAQGEFVDLGTGILDWPRILRGAVQNAVREYIIENDDQNDPRTSPRSANMYRFLRSVRF